METESPADGNPPCSALYVHIPFCHSICPFCAFAMHANRQGLHDEYLRMLDRELRAQAPAVNIPAGGLDSVYIGGGTPSTLSAGQVENLLGAIQEVCSLAGQAETAFELNPEDVKKDYVRQLVALGVNRMSLGVQSFNEGTLKTMERGHDSAQACAAMDVLAAHGPANINVDLMCGVPGQTLRQAQEDITALKRWEPAHVSLYYLDMEPGTLFRRRLDRGLSKCRMVMRRPILCSSYGTH
ncbi:MAG: radical SAM protein [Deltaproteobacteria bacterium]|nr:radical SAM protein [Deltaproteobacteria bacterium]